MIRVGFNARLLADPGLRGWNRYTVNLLARLPAHGVRPVLYSMRPVHPEHLARLPAGSFEEGVSPPMRGLLSEQVWLPRQAARDRVRVLHSPFNFALPVVAPCPLVLTLHDAIEQVYYSRRQSWRERLRPHAVVYSLQHWLARVRADHVITVSEHAKRDIATKLRIPARRITVTYEAADPHFHDPVPPELLVEVRAKYRLPDRYLFYVGGWEGRKNVRFLVRGWQAAGVPGLGLVLAGGNESQKAAFRGPDALHLCGWVDEADLPALYAGAVGFVYPSEYEGFGLQLCEAMAAGCPVLAARATCLPEVLGDGGDTFGLADVSELAGLIRRLATDDGYRAGLVERGRRRAAFFSWDRCAAETAAVYRRLC